MSTEREALDKAFAAYEGSAGLFEATQWMIQKLVNRQRASKIWRANFEGDGFSATVKVRPAEPVKIVKVKKDTRDSSEVG